MILNFSKLKNKQVIIRLIVNILFILLITVVFWMPLLETSFFTDYVVYENNSMASTETIVKQALEIKELFTTEDNAEYVYEIGIHIIILIFLPILAIKRFWKENVHKKEYIFFFILSIFCLFMATKYFPWDFLGKYLELIQFPWRMLVFANFFLCIVCSINVQIVIKNFKIKDDIFFCIICILYLFTLKDHIILSDNVQDIDKWKIGYLSQNKSHAIAGMGKGEYLPVKANNSREYIINRLDEIYILDGEAKVEDYTKEGQKLTAKIYNNENEAVLELPYIYYPGYNVKFNNKEIKTFETENGFIGINIQNSGFLEVEYIGTNISKISKIISLIGVSFFIVYIIIFKKKEN